jgi:hypothetical protein
LVPAAWPAQLMVATRSVMSDAILIAAVTTKTPGETT